MLSHEKTPVHGNGNFSEDVQYSSWPQHGNTKLRIVSGLLGVACGTIVVLVIVLLTGIACSSGEFRR